LNLPNPKMMDIAVPGNLNLGIDFTKQKTINGLSFKDFNTYIKTNEFRLIDLREKEEIKKNGIIRNATNIPFHTFLDTFKKNTKLDNKKKYLLYCAVGQRSSLALQVMQSYGFKDSYHLIGGIKEWIKNNNPLELDS